MANKGYVLLHRSLQDCWVWFDDDRFSKGQAWVDLILLANHKDTKISFKEGLIIVKRGQFITSIRKLAERWGWAYNTTKRFLNLLESDNMLMCESDNKKTLITIVNYEKFQFDDNSIDAQTDAQTDARADSQADDQMANKLMTNNKCRINEINKRKDISNDISQRKVEGKNNVYSDNPELEAAFKDFVTMRNKIKKPMTAKAVSRLKARLTVLSNGDVNLAIKILNQSVDHCWQDVYSLKDEYRVDENNPPVSGTLEYEIENHITHPQEPPYYGFPVEWFEDDKPVKERFRAIKQIKNPSVSVTDEIIFTPEQLWEKYLLRKDGYERYMKGGFSDE